MQCPHTLLNWSSLSLYQSTNFKMTLITKKHPLPFPYVQFSWCALFMKATPTNYRIYHNFNCYINKRETCKTCLANYKGSIFHHIMPLVINSLGGGHTHKHTDIVDKSNLKETSHTLAFGQYTPGLKMRKIIFEVHWRLKNLRNKCPIWYKLCIYANKIYLTMCITVDYLIQLCNIHFKFFHKIKHYIFMLMPCCHLDRSSVPLDIHIKIRKIS